MDGSRSRTRVQGGCASGRCQGSCLRRGRRCHAWYKYLGSYGKPVSIEQFGLQGDGAQNMIDLGITAEHVVEAAKASIAEVEAAK